MPFVMMALALCFLTLQCFGEITHTNGTILFKGNDFALSFSDTNGSLLFVTPAGQDNSLFVGGEFGLWNATFKEGGSINSTAFNASSTTSTYNWLSDTGGHALILNYSNAQITVSIRITEQTNGVDFQAQISPAQKTVLELSLPARLRWQPDGMKRLICPWNSNESLGAAFKPGFFKYQPETSPAGWTTVSKGPDGYTSLFGAPMVSMPDNTPATPISFTSDAVTWLGSTLINTWTGTNANVNRPSMTNQVDLTLATSANGPFFAASHLGGKGYLFRLGGNVAEAQQNLALDLVVASIEHLALSAAGRTNVALISLTRGPTSGGWASVTTKQWQDRLNASTVLASSNVKIVVISSVQELLDDLASTNFLAVINPYGEWTPVLEQGGLSKTLYYIKNYVRNGGNWFEAGGYSFYYELRPTHYLSCSIPYPPAFSDFIHFDGNVGNATLFGVQPQQWQPWAGVTNTNAIFVSGNIGWGADAQGAYAERAFETFVNPKQTWQSPVVRLIIGQEVQTAIDSYCQANQFSRKLENKMEPDVFNRLKNSVLVYYEGNCSQKMANLNLLPTPCLVHFADYLMGGFDKQYPDHLPPNAWFGTPEEFSAFIQQCHQLGLLMMPYSNPTWWCDHPRGPTFTREGEAPLLKKLDGSISYELYGANDGYTVCHWHPAVREANRITLQQFTTDYPMDLVFQDQCGARTWQYDLNTASPTPYAYSDGMISMVAEDSRTKPLGTENGWDRIANYESLFCGMTWGIVPTEGAPSYRTFLDDRYSPENWDLFPLALYMTHDKTMLLHHDLGQFVTTDPVLSWTLGLGYGLSYRSRAVDLTNRPSHEWLLWLDRLQKSVCSKYIGQPLVSFKQDRGTNLTSEPDGVICATYGNVSIAANLTGSTKQADGVLLAPYGYHITAPGLIAARLASTNANQQAASFVIESTATNADLWVYSGGDQSIAVALPQKLDGKTLIQWDSGTTNTASMEVGNFTVDLGFKPDQERILPPANLAGLAPKDWTGQKPAVGILNIPSMPRAWTSITATDWTRAFTNSSLLTKLGVPIRQITSFQDLTNALYEGPTSWLAIINPSGEIFPESAAGQWTNTLNAIKYYVDHGGSWWETAGYSFYTAAYVQSGVWKTETIGSSGLNFFSLPIEQGEVDQAAEPLTVTDLGQTVFGESISSQLLGLKTSVNRGLSRDSDDPGHLTLLAGAQSDFLGAYRLDGWGYLWRFGGFSPNPNIVLPSTVAAMEYLYTHTMLSVPAGQTRYLWHGKLTVDSRPKLKNARIDNGHFAITISNCPIGATNYIQKSVETLTSWQDVFSFPSPENETNWIDPIPMAILNAFYRVKCDLAQ